MLCSVMKDGDELLQLKLAEGFQPSVPFVAAASAALVIAQALKALCFPELPAVHQFLFGNVFAGPELNAALSCNPRISCTCVVHRSLLLNSRSARMLEKR